MGVVWLLVCASERLTPRLPRTAPQLNLEKAFNHHDTDGKGTLHAHELAELVKRALPASIAAERKRIVTLSYYPENGGVTWAGGGVSIGVR